MKSALVAHVLERIGSSSCATSAHSIPSVGGVTAARQALGRRGEEIVARRLVAAGWRIVARNARVDGLRGELDIVAVQGETLVFVEVKTVSAATVAGPASPLEMVGPRKQGKLRALAGAWAGQNRPALPRLKAIRIDVVGLRIDGRGNVCGWEHVEAAC